MHELADITEFLGALPGFACLDHTRLDQAAAAVRIAYFRAGTVILERGQANPELNIVRSGAVEVRDAEGELLIRAAEGDLFGLPSLMNATPASNRATALEDSLVYQLDGETFTELRRVNSEFEAYCVRALTDRLLAAAAESEYTVPADVPVTTAISREPVCLPASATVLEAARLMTAERVSALLLTEEGELEGIVTDRDLRTRVLARGAETSAPVRSIMTPQPVSLDAGSTIHEAALAMLDNDIHHLPVMRTRRVVGLVTRSDLMKLQTEHPLYIVNDIRRQGSMDAVAGECARLPGLLLRQIDAGASGEQIGRFITAVADAATRHLIRLAERELGSPPCQFVWMALGSQARREQSARSDQDNALIVDDTAGKDDLGYFLELAERVNTGLAACGMDICPGDVMARNPLWCQPLSNWRRYFADWIQEPDQRSLMHANIFFDLRGIYGATDLVEELRAEICQHARGNTIFLSLMARNALTLQPPLGFFRQFVLERSGAHKDTLDLKRQGIMPIVEIARIRCLATGEPDIGTRKRLLAAAARGEIAETDARNLIDALDFIERLRLEHQARQMHSGSNPDNHLSPAEISRLVRENLKAAFTQIRISQAALANRFHIR